MSERTTRRNRSAGSIRKLPSGSWQARVRDGRGDLVAVGTFPSRREADRAVTLALADQARSAWVDPRRGRVPFEEYATEWLEHRVGLRPKTRELYEGILRLHVVPWFERVELARISPRAVRAWNADLLRTSRPGASTAAKSYRLLRSILATAVVDELIVKNPCLLKGAGNEHAPERPVASIEQVHELAAIVTPRYRALVLLATYGTLRLGEAVALRRRNLDLLHRTVRIEEQCVLLKNGRLEFGPPKTAAGVRLVAIPAAIVPDLEAHLAAYAAGGPDGLVFAGPKGAPLHRGSWYYEWRRATLAVGVEGLRFHDLRHTGNTLAAATGASTKELMSRMGHASPRAALIYQHATRERDEVIAAALSEAIDAAVPEPRAGIRSLASATGE